MRSLLSKSSLYWLAALVLVMAFLTWSLRRQNKLQARLAALQTSQTSRVGAMPDSRTRRAQDQRATQRAIALLCRALLADARLTYTATTETWAKYGGKTMKTQAFITRAPRNLCIDYLSGDKQGSHAGFSERWFWRQDSLGAPMKPFAAMRRDTAEIATRRFTALLENYRADWKGAGIVDGRAVQIVELWPFAPVEGAAGPGKRLAVDKATGLVLKVETFNHRRQPVMVTQLSDVQINPHIAQGTFKAPQTILASAQKQSWVAQDMGQDAQAVARQTGLLPPRLAPNDLPPGFKLEAVGMHRCAERGSYAALSRYTDGLNTLTVFSMKETDASSGSAAPKGEQSCEFGPGALVMRDTGDGRLIAVGDLPPATLRRVAEKAHVERVEAAPHEPAQN